MLIPMKKNRYVRFAAVSVLFLCTGCEVEYFSHLVFGQLESLARTVSIAEALEDPNLTQEEKDKLVFLQEVREFGIDRIGLFAGDAYTIFEANGTEPAAYVLTASAKDSLTPFLWDLPFVGLTGQKGFFDEAMGQREADLLVEQGYDVLYTTAAGFSTLGALPDPIRQSNLRMDEFSLAEFLLHEMTHSTVFKPSDTDFNEAMATFVGRAAAQAWFDEKHGPNSDEATGARMRFADEAVIDDYVIALFDESNEYYTEAAARGDTKEAIITGREAVFQSVASRFDTDYLPRLADPDRWTFVRDLPLDNARILVGVRYQGGLSDFAAVLTKTHGDFPAALEVFAEAARQTESREYLQNWAAAP